MDILLIRHGESEASFLHVIEAKADFNLSDKGREQGKRMLMWASANYSIDKLSSTRADGQSRSLDISTAKTPGNPFQRRPYEM
jgi:2,3-bisphosphoglycerate-dependent phosphoglycerate mutase